MRTEKMTLENVACGRSLMQRVSDYFGAESALFSSLLEMRVSRGVSYGGVLCGVCWSAAVVAVSLVEPAWGWASFFALAGGVCVKPMFDQVAKEG